MNKIIQGNWSYAASYRGWIRSNGSVERAYAAQSKVLSHNEESTKEEGGARADVMRRTVNELSKAENRKRGLHVLTSDSPGKALV